MRIELPLPSWADTAPRADDDAHTLTVAAMALEWTPWQWDSHPSPSVRLQVDATRTATLTLTL